MCELLLKSGADYSSYVSGNPPLVTAAATGNTTIVQLLIDAGSGFHILYIHTYIHTVHVPYTRIYSNLRVFIQPTLDMHVHACIHTYIHIRT